MFPLLQVHHDDSTEQQSSVDSAVLATATKRRKLLHHPHPTSTLSRSAGTYARLKSTIACFVCRKRKTKCDNQRPVCGFCQTTGGECSYVDTPPSKYDQASTAILSRLDALEGSLGSMIQDAICRTCARSPANGEDERNDQPDNSMAKTNLKHSNLGMATFTCGDFGSSPNSETPPKSATILKASADMSVESILRWQIFGHYLKPLDRLRFSSFNNSLPSTPGGNGCDDLKLSLDSVSPLLESFMANILPSNPILDPAILRQTVSSRIKRGIGYDGESCFVLLILALGSISNSIRSLAPGSVDLPGDHTHFTTAERYFWASQLRIGILYCGNDKISVQCAFFTAIYLSFTMRTVSAWKAFSQAGTQCLAYLTSRGMMDNPSIDKHQTGEQSHHSISEESEDQLVLEDSLYWVILKGEIELCLELGLPGSALLESPYPHIFPHTPNLERLNPSPSSKNYVFENSDRQHFSIGWLYYLGEIALRRLQNRALQYQYNTQLTDGSRGTRLTWETVEGEYSRRAKEFDEQLDQWMKSLPQPLRFSATNTEPLDNHLKWVLRSHRLDVIELLRFPALRRVLNTCFTSPTLDSRLPEEIVLLAREYLDAMTQRVASHAEEFMHRHQGTWLMIHKCTRSVLVILGAKLKCQESPSSTLAAILLPPNWRETVLVVLKMLRMWERESADVVRLRMTVETLLEQCLV